MENLKQASGEIKHRYAPQMFQCNPYGNYSTLDSHANTVISHTFAYSSRWRRKPWRGLYSPGKQAFLLDLQFASGDVSRRGMSATQLQKFHTDDINQCLQNNSHGDPNANMFNFTFPLVDFGKMLCSSANELQQNSNASSREAIFLKYWLFC